MANGPDDFDGAHLEFLRQRLDEATVEGQEAVKALGEAYGVDNLTLDDVTPEHMEQLIQQLAQWIRRQGNAALADRYQEAYADTARALREQARWLLLRQERTLTDAENLRAVAADVAAENASEHYERVQSDVTAYLAHLKQLEE